MEQEPSAKKGSLGICASKMSVQSGSKYLLNINCKPFQVTAISKGERRFMKYSEGGYTEASSSQASSASTLFSCILK